MRQFVSCFHHSFISDFEVGLAPDWFFILLRTSLIRNAFDIYRPSLERIFRMKHQVIYKRNHITPILVRRNFNMFDEKGSSGDVIIEEKRSDLDDIVVTRMPNEEPKPSSFTDEFASSVKEVAQKTGEVFNKATESISKAIETALSARDHVVLVRLNDESLTNLPAPVQSSISKSGP